MNIYSTLKNIESPLNYIGGKFELLDFIKDNLPKDINNFYDLFAGGFNVGVNIKNCNSVIYNDYNYYVKDLIETLLTKDIDFIIDYIEIEIDKYKLVKKEKEPYYKLRENFNKIEPKLRNPLDLYLLILYGFQHQIRFNTKHGFNNPIGTSGYSSSIKKKLIEFNDQKFTTKYIFINDDFRKFKTFQFENNDFVYCDPPYLITMAAYNDGGKRGFDGWDEKIEKEFLNFLDILNNKNIKFMLSNVIEHNKLTNKLLEEWIFLNNLNIIEYKGKSKSKRKELIVMNY